MKIILKILLICIVFSITIITGFRINDSNNNNKLEKIKEGMNISDCRNILGNPDESRYYNNKIMDVYYYFPLGEARCFYSKNNKALVKLWKTDCD